MPARRSSTNRRTSSPSNQLSKELTHPPLTDEASAKCGGTSDSAPAPITTREQLIDWVAGKAPEQWFEWLIAALDENELLRQRLMRAATRDVGALLDISAVKREMVKATTPPSRGYVDYEHADAFCSQVEEACVTRLEELMQLGAAAEVVELAEYCLLRKFKFRILGGINFTR